MESGAAPTADARLATHTPPILLPRRAREGVLGAVEGATTSGRRRVSAWLALGITLLAFAGSLAWAADTNVTAVVKSAEKPSLYDIDVSGAEIKSVLEMLSRRSGANIVVSPEITGEANAHLKQLSIEAILDFMSAAQNFQWEKRDGTYLVTPKPQQPAEAQAHPAPAADAPQVLVWECRHIRPTDVASMVSKLLPAIKIAEGPNSVSPKLDTGSGGLATTGGGSTTTSTSTDSVKNNSTRVVLIGPADDIAGARDMLTKLDVGRKQISIEVAITEIGSTASKELGINWSWSDYALKEAAATGIGFGKFSQQGMSITGTLSALIKDGKANLLAQPNISVLDGECADILIGDRILFPKLIGYNINGTPMFDKEEEKVGIYLQIAPKVAGDDEIIMTLYPQVSLVTAYLKTQAGDYPQISTREARTTVSVRNGSTLAIGGLLRKNELDNISKIPLLGDLPVLGQFFRHNKKTTELTEIVILLSPKVTEEQ